MVRFRFLIKVAKFFFKCLFLYFICVFTMISNCVTLKCNKHILLLLEKITKIRLGKLPFMSIIIKLEKKM